MGGKGEKKQVSAQSIRQIPSLFTSPSQVPLHNRYEALELGRQANSNVEEGPTRLEGSSKASQPIPCITETSIKKKRLLSQGTLPHSLLRRTEGPIFWADPAHREVCCLPEIHVRGITRKVICLIQTSDCHPLLFFHVGNDEVAKRSPRAIKRYFRALGQLVKGSGARVVLFSILPVPGKFTGKSKQTQMINTWLQGSCH